MLKYRFNYHVTRKLTDKFHLFASLVDKILVPSAPASGTPT
jgi:hypothetical protein